jgi:predicted permease
MADWAREVRARLSSLRLSPTREQEIVEELSQHLDDRWRDLVAGGVAEEDATAVVLAEWRQHDRLAARLAPLAQARTPAPTVTGTPVGRALAALWQDLRHAARRLRAQPAFSGVAVATLALGIGATTAIVTLVYGVLLKPLPFERPDELVALYHVTPASPTTPQSPATYFTYRDHGRVFQDIGLWTIDDVSAVRDGEPEQVQALRVTSSLLSLLGVRPEQGRLLQAQDDTPDAPRRALLTHAYRARAFGPSNGVVGQSIVIDGAAYEVVGVLPSSFRLLDTDPQVVLPLRPNRATAVVGPLRVNGIARLKPGVTLAQANADIARMIPLITRQFPLMPGVTPKMWDALGLAPNVRPLAEAAVGQMRRPLWLLLGAVVVVLLMAWTNVGNLLLVRADQRQREFAVRAALGASRARMAAELVVESLLLGLAGAAGGVLVAEVGLAVLRRMAPVALPRAGDIGIGVVVLLVTLAIAVVTSLLFGLVPALRCRVFDVAVLRDGGRSSTDAPGRHRARTALVVAQIALALVLLVVSGLMARTFVAMEQVRPGFTAPREVQTFDIALPPSLVPDRRQVVQTYEAIVARLNAVPGITAIGLGWIRLDGRAGRTPVYVEGRTTAALAPIRSTWSIGPGYFQALGNPLVAGRALDWPDIRQSRPVVVISENLAREYWETPVAAIGKRIGLSPQGPWQEVVGVAGDVRGDGLNRPAPTLVYFPLADEEAATRTMTYIVRSRRVGSPGFLRDLQQAVQAVNPDVALANLRTLGELEARSMAGTSFALVMLAIAAFVGVSLAFVGIYGVVTYIAAERTREVGIRMALGAQRGDVRRLFLRYGLGLTAMGTAVGIGASMLVTPVLSALLYGVGRMDPLTYLAVALAIGAVTVLATYLPARRASRVDPLIALRSAP